MPNLFEPPTTCPDGVEHAVDNYRVHHPETPRGPTEHFLAEATPTQCETVKLLNDSLATELVCAMRYRRNCFAAEVAGLDDLAQEFLRHSLQELDHADMLAKRICELGGRPDFSPDALGQRSHAAFDDSQNLTAMLTATLLAEQASIETYLQIIDLLGTTDPVTTAVLNHILCDELEHETRLKCQTLAWLAIPKKLAA
jgi:bacterioferritin